MEDNLNFLLMKDNLNYLFVNGRQPHVFQIKVNPLLLHMEDDLQFFVDGRLPQLFCKWKMTIYFCKWNTTSSFQIKDNSIFFTNEKQHFFIL